MNLHCKIHYDLVHFNKMSNALINFSDFLQVRWEKECSFIQQFQETKIICDQLDKQFATTKKKLIFSAYFKQNILTVTK